MKTGIYKITNLCNNKIYIGQSVNIDKRWYEHKYKSECMEDRSYNSAIHAAFRKYGIDNFSFEILQECSVDELDELEKYYIAQFDTLCPNGYNILSGGQKQRRNIYTCSNCNKIIERNNSGLCRSCYNVTQRVVERPSALELAIEICDSNFCAVGRKYGVSDNAIRKWCLNYNIPTRKKELKEWLKTRH